MIIIKREIQTLSETGDKSKRLDSCQAAFNSDGNITIRNYDRNSRNKDEILILAPEETHAIINLFSRLGTICRNNTMPF